MSVPEQRRERPAEAVAGFLAAASVAVSAIGIAYKPVRTIPIALLVALVALAIGGRHHRLAAFAVAAGAVAFVLGMTIAVATQSALW